MGAIALLETTLASSVNDDATFTVSYPSGVTQAMLLGAETGKMVVNGDAIFSYGASGFTASYGASNITVTNTTGATLAAGTELILSFGDTTQAGRFVPDVRVRGVVALTAATGTASNTIADVTGSFVQATLNNNFKSLADKVNEMRAALVSAGILNG
jgi:hypothetical protein